MGMSKPSDRGAMLPVQSLALEIEIDKGKRPISDTQLGKGGEGTSGIDK